MASFNPKVLLTLINEATGEAFATSEMSPADLPESFDADTTLQLGGEEWSVVHADPPTREGYTTGGTLILRLRKVETIGSETIGFSQLDITERFNDDEALQADEWISTTALNATISNPESVGLPPPGAGSDEVYRIALRLSQLREAIAIPNDGVYCPICHIANIELAKLRTPCPKCGRGLLKFGWD